MKLLGLYGTMLVKTCFTDSAWLFVLKPISHPTLELPGILAIMRTFTVSKNILHKTTHPLTLLPYFKLNGNSKF
jgi:hypothetical protein